MTVEEKVLVTKSKLDSIADEINTIRGSTNQIKINDMITILSAHDIEQWNTIGQMYARDGTYTGDAHDINLGYLTRIPYYMFFYGINTGSITGKSVLTIYKRGLALSKFSAVSFPKLKSLSFEALAGMSNLTTLKLDALTYLDQYALTVGQEQTTGASLRTYYYDNLEKIELGASVTTQATINIDLTNFRKLYMPKLTGIYLDYTTVPINNASITIPTDTTGDNALPNIYVPSDLVDQYKAATNWAVWSDYIKAQS